MAILTFDTHNFIARLKAAGIEEKKAVAIADAFKEVSLENVVTKDDLRTTIAELKADLFKWLIPILLGQVAVFAAVVKLLL